MGTDGNNFVVARYLGTGGSAGTLDTTFGSGIGYVTNNFGAPDTAYAVVIQSDGKIVVAGNNNTGSSSDYAIARYLTNGNLDTVANGGSGFGNIVPASAPGYILTHISGSDVAYAITLQTDGKIIASGKSGTNYSLARYTTAGVLDTTFNGTGTVTTNISGTDIAYGVKVQSNGAIVAAGVSGNNFSAARYTTSGTIDTTFGGGTGKVMTNLGGTDAAYGCVINSNGTILLAGTDGTNIALVEYTTLGILNTASFGAGTGIVTTNIGTGSIDGSKACAIQPDGNIVVAGVSLNKIAMARYTPTGALDTSFGVEGIVSGSLGTTTASIIYGVAIQTNGYIVVTGAAANSGSTPNRFMVARYTPTGVLDTTGFNAADTPGYVVTNVDGSGADVAYGIIIDSLGRIVVAGYSGNNFGVARYLSTGVLDTIANGGTGFGPGGTAPGYVTTNLGGADIAYGLALTDSGKIVVAGVSDSSFGVAQYTSEGILDTGAFGSGLGYVITAIGTTAIGYSVAINSIGKILVGGVATTLGNGNFAIAQYTSGGVLDTGAFGSGLGYVTTDFGGTDIVSALALQSNDYIVVSGTSGGDFALARYTTTGSLDGTFGSGGTVTTSIPGATVSSSVGLFLQPNGRIVTCATSSSLDGDFVTVRYLGDAAPQGCIDVTYQSNGYESYPTGGSSEYNPRVTGLQVQADNSMYVASQDLLTTVESRLVKLNADGSIALSAITIDQPGVTDIIEDSQKNVLVVGTNATPNGWIRRYTTVSSFIADSTFGTSGLVTETNASSFKRVCQQESGQIIAMGQGSTATTGILIAYNSLGAINTTGFGVSGIYSIASRTFSDMVIGSDSTIYIVYQGATDIEICRVKADGSGLVVGYNAGSAIDTGLVSASYGVPSISFDNNGKLLLIAVEAATSAIVVQRYTTTGVLDVSVTIPQATSLLTSPVIKQLQCDTNNRPLFVGYSANDFFVGRIQNTITGGLDTTFAPYSAVSYTAAQGILKATYNDEDPTDSTTPKRVASVISIGANGGILFGGYEAINSTNSISLIARVVGDTTPYGQVDRYPRQTVGGIDQMFGSAGNLSLASIAPSGIAKAIYVYDSGSYNGKILVAIDTGLNTILAQLNADYTLNTTSFGSSGGTGGSITLTSMIQPQNIMLDTVGNIYLTCKDALTELWNLTKIAPDGSSILWQSSTNFTLGKDLREQSGGRILATGNSDTTGVIVGFNPNTGAVDQYFGNNLGTNQGYYATNATSPVADIVVLNNTSDEIVLAYWHEDHNHAHIESLNANGSLDNPNFTAGSPIMGVISVDQIHLHLDKDGKIVVVATTASGFTASRYLATGANDVINVTIPVTNPSTAYLQNITTLSDGSTLILGSNSNGNQIIVARLNSAFALDTTFNTTGILQEGDLPMTQFYDIGVTSTIDNNIVVAGASISPVPYLTNVYNNVAVTQALQQASAVATPGTLDQTLNAYGATPGYFDLHTDLGTTQLSYSQAIQLELNITNDTYYIAGDNGIDTQITCMNGFTDIQSTAFGAGSGVITLTGQISVADMFLNIANNLLVVGGAGSSGSNAGWVNYYNGTTGAAIAGFSVTDVLDTNYAVGQQTTDRILVAGQEDGIGTIIAYDLITGALDASFDSDGRYTTGYSSPITSLLVATDDSIAFVSNNGNNATTQKISINGTALWTGDSVIANNTVASNSHLSYTTNGDIITIGVDTTTPQIVIKKYNGSTGITSATLNLTNAVTGFTSPYITNVVVDINNKIVFSGYDDVTNDTAFVGRVLADLSGLDTTFNPSPAANPGIQPYKIAPASTVRAWNDLHINGLGRVLATGFVNISGNDTPYFIRFYGDAYASEYETVVPTGGEGTLDLNFATNGTFGLSTLDAVLTNTAAMNIISMSDGKAYITADNGTNSFIVKLANTNPPTLDVSYNTSGAVLGISENAPSGVHAMYMDGSDYILLTGTNGSGGWIQRYATNGTKDTSFGSSGVISGQMSACQVIIQQTLGRYIVVGTSLIGGYGVVRGYTLSGQLDTTFQSTGVVPGEYNTGITNGIYTLIIDTYDRLYIAYKNGSNIDIARLTSDGYLDTQFGVNGIISSIITNADDASQVQVVIDSFSNVVVAAHINNGTNKIAIAAYDITGTIAVYPQLNITSFTSPVLTNMIAKTGGSVELSGYQSGNNPMWVARILSTGTLDEFYGVDSNGIMFYTISSSVQTARVGQGLAIRSNGELSAVGYEVAGGINSPFLIRAYDRPYQQEIMLALGLQPVGTNDITLGASSLTASNVGVVFYATATATDNTAGQVARAIALQDDAHILVAVDGGASNGATTPSNIYLKMFNIDGVADTTFGTAGQRTVLTTYANQYVQDMVTFTTVAGVNKAILAGYTYNSTLPAVNQYSSLLLQYNVDTHALDSEFGQFNGNAVGIACGDGKQLFTVGQQSSGRIIVAGLSQDDLGLLLGYTSAGKLDTSFGSNGYQSSNTGTTGIYTQAIDTQNRVVIAYDNGSNTVIVSRFLADGSDLDSSFVTPTSPITTLFGGSSNMRVAIDSSNNIVVAAVTNTGNEITFKKYSSSGGAPTSSIVVPYNLLGGASTASYVFAQLIIDTVGNVIAVCHDTDAEKILVLRLTSALALDTTTFNAPNGYLLYAIDGGVTSQVATDALIHPDGRIIIVGSEA